jgi:hypothetical protein
MLASSSAGPDGSAPGGRGRAMARMLPGGGGETPRGVLALAMRHRRALLGAYLLALHLLAYALMTHASAARQQCQQ